MKNRIETLKKALLLSKKQVFSLKIWKFWRGPTTIDFNIFCEKHVSYLPLSTKVQNSKFQLFISSYTFCIFNLRVVT